MSQKRKLPDHQPSPSSLSLDIYTSHPIHDRSSKFTALFSTSSPYLSDPSLLQKHPSLQGSTHRILAWRKPSSQTTLSGQLLVTSSDEDGEKWAGKRLERVLAEEGVEGVCVVGRWYGGVMLGPVRFEHIERCAREAVALWKADRDLDLKREGGRDVKRVKEDGEEVRVQLVKMLKDRDESVRVLRGLLVDKQASLARLKCEGGGEQSVGLSSPSSSSSPAKAQNYDGLDVARLRTLEKARDATLAWILRQIEGVEREIENVEKIESEKLAKVSKAGGGEGTKDAEKVVVGCGTGGDGSDAANEERDGDVDGKT